MSIKDLISNRRGEVASLILIVGMVVATLGVITGSQVVEQRIKTATRAAEPSPALLAQVGGACDSQCQSIGYDFGNCSPTATCTSGTSHSSYACLAGRSACCCGYYPPTNTPIPPTATNTPIPKIFVINGTVKYSSGQGAEGITIKLLKYNASYQRSQVAQTTTDANGNYQFSNVIEGTYDVEPQSTPTQSISPALQTLPLITSPFTVTVPNFTASGNPPVTNTPVPPTATNTPTIPTISCTSLTGTLSNGQLNLNLSVTNGLNPFYYQIKKGATTVAQGSSTNASTATIAVPNPTEGLYKAYVLNTQNGFYRSSTGCEYTYTSSTATPIPPTSTPTSTAPPTVLRPDVLIQSATTSFNTAGGMTLTTIFKNIGNANVNYVGAHAMKVEVALNTSSPNCSVTNLVGLAGLAPGATLTHTTYFPTNIYSGCPNFTPQAGTTYLLTLTADPTDIIRELNENNNIKSLSFTQPTPLIPTVPPTATPTSNNPPPATNTPKATKTPTKTPTPSPTAPPDATTTPTKTITPSPTASPTPLPGTTVDVKMNITIINPQSNYSVWGTAQEITTGASAPAAIKCNLGDSTQSLTVINCPQLKRGKTYEFVALAKAKLPGATTIRSDKNSYLIPAGPNDNPRSQNKTITLPGPTQQPTQPPTATPTTPVATNTPGTSTQVNVNMKVTIINPQANYNIWGTAQELTGGQITPTPVRCNTGDSTQAVTTVKCPQLKRGHSYEFVALAKERMPNSQTIQSEKNTYLIPGSSNITPQDQTKTITLPGLTQAPTQPATATPSPTVPAADLPDLKIMTTSHSPIANAVTFDSAVKNIGNRDVNLGGSIHDVYYQLKESANVKCSAAFARNQVDHMQPGDTVQLRATLDPNNAEWNCATGFTFQNDVAYSLVITLDHFKRINESDETNNVFTYNFTYNSQGATATPTQQPTTPTMTPTDTPVPGTPTPTPLRAICQDILVNGDTAQKYDVIFLPSGYGDYNRFEADAREAMSHYKNAIPSALQSKYNYKVFTNLEKGYMVTTCQSTTNGLKYPCWSSFYAKEAMRNCNGDGYVILHYTPKPSEDANKAAEALAKYGNVKALTLGKNSGEMIVLRYDLSELTKIVAGTIVGGGENQSLIMQLLERVLQRFR